MQGRSIYTYFTVSLLFLLFQFAPGINAFANDEQDTVRVDERDTAVIDAFTGAVQLFNGGNYSLAMDHFRSIIESHPQTSQGIESRYYLGMVYRNIGQHENARMTLQTFALTFPDHRRAPDAWLNVADIYAEQNRFSDAGLALERLFQFHPDHQIIPDAMFRASTFFEKAGDRKKSDEYLRRIILQHSRSDVILQARLRFGAYRIDDGSYSQAGNVFRRVIAEIPEQASDDLSVAMRAEATLGLARSYHYVRVLDRAEEEYARVMNRYQNTPSFAHALLYRGELHQQQGQHLEAVDLFRRAQRATEGSDRDQDKFIARRAMFGIAQSYNALGDYSSAATFFDLYARQYAGTASKDELVRIWQGAARSNEGMRNYHRAVEWWDRIVDIDPPNIIKEEAYIRSAMNNIAARNYRDAADRFGRYTERFNTPTTAEALFRLGNLYENQLNDPRRALAAYEELAYRFPESRFIDDAVYGQARMHLTIGNDRNAHHIVGEFQQRFPGSELLAEANALKDELEMYHLQDRDGGFQSITMLMSEMIAGSPRGELAFQLGDIYLNKLKQYPEAARQFETALSLDLPQEKKTRAEYLYAYSLYRTAHRHENRRQEMLAKLRDLSDRPARTPNIETISFYHLEVLQIVAGPAEFINAAEKYIQTYPRSDHTPIVRFMLANTLEEIGEGSNAVEQYGNIVQQFQNQPVAGEALIRLARHHAIAGDDQEAGTYFTSYIRRYSRGNHIADAMLSAADILMRQNKYGEAIDMYSQFTRTFPYHGKIDNAREQLAIALKEENRNREALELFVDIIDWYEMSYYNPSEVPGHILFNAGVAAHRSGAKDRATEYLTRYIVQDRSSEQAGIASIILGELYNERGEAQIAGYHYGRALEIIPARSANRDIADLLYFNGHYEHAVQHLNAVAEYLESNEEKKVYRIREITALLRSGKIDEGRRRIERFRTDFPNERNALVEFEFEIAMRQFRNRSYDNAARSFQQLIQQHGGHEKAAYAHFYLGRTWEAVGRRREAKNKYEEIFQKFPNSGIIPDVHLAYAGLLLREEQFIEAIDNYRIVMETAYEEDDLMYFAMQNIAQAYEEIGFNEAALETIDDFIERFPNDPAVSDKHVKIGTLYQRARLYERSVEKFQSLILFADRALETELRYYTGDSFHMMGNYERAIREFRTVAEIDPRTTQLDWTATALYMAGQSYEQMGKPQEAIAMYQEIIDRRGIEGQYKAAARQEINRVRAAMNKSN